MAATVKCCSADCGFSNEHGQRHCACCGEVIDQSQPTKDPEACAAAGHIKYAKDRDNPCAYCPECGTYLWPAHP
ncbi:MAG: hypothetical protein ABIB97_01315 [Patescibacteria group bacterium]